MVKCIRINNYANNKIIIHSIQKRLNMGFFDKILYLSQFLSIDK